MDNQGNAVSGVQRQRAIISQYSLAALRLRKRQTLQLELHRQHLGKLDLIVINNGHLDDLGCLAVFEVHLSYGPVGWCSGEIDGKGLVSHSFRIIGDDFLHLDIGVFLYLDDDAHVVVHVFEVQAFQSLCILAIERLNIVCLPVPCLVAAVELDIIGTILRHTQVIAYQSRSRKGLFAPLLVATFTLIHVRGIVVLDAEPYRFGVIGLYFVYCFLPDRCRTLQPFVVVL